MSNDEAIHGLTLKVLSALEHNLNEHRWGYVFESSYRS